jgi:hypothetical protein
VICQWLGSLLIADQPPERLDQMSIRDFADLPTVHPVTQGR